MSLNRNENQTERAPESPSFVKQRLELAFTALEGRLEEESTVQDTITVPDKRKLVERLRRRMPSNGNASTERNGITYSVKLDNGKTVFTLQAEKSVQDKEGESVYRTKYNVNDSAVQDTVTHTAWKTDRNGKRTPIKTSVVADLKDIADTVFPE